MEYILISEPGAGRLTSEINTRLQQGWRLHGHTFPYCLDPGAPSGLAQAVVREAEAEPEEFDDRGFEHPDQDINNEDKPY